MEQLRLPSNKDTLWQVHYHHLNNWTCKLWRHSTRVSPYWRSQPTPWLIIAQRRGWTKRWKEVKAIYFLSSTKMLERPGPASSEVKHLLCKIAYIGDQSWNPASSKMTPRVFHAQINFVLSVTAILQKMLLEFWIGAKRHLLESNCYLEQQITWRNGPRKHDIM